MRLIKCYVSSFGKLKNLSIDFNDEINVFKQENGWGKSTLTVFIKSMFYGLDDTKRSVSDNERTKYKPWDFAGKFGGNVEFEWGGKEFRIERYFGAKSSEDSLKLFDIESGKEYAKTEDLGKRIFEVDEEGFFSTAYFSQKDFNAKTNSSITAKFNALSQPEDESVFETAFKKIEDKAKEYKPLRGDNGIISNLKLQRLNLDSEIKQVAIADQVANELRSELKTAETKTAEYETQLSALRERLAIAGKGEAISLKKSIYNKALADKKEKEIAINKCQVTLNGNRPTIEEIDAFENCLNDYKDMLIKEQAVIETVRGMQSLSPVQNEKTKFPFIVCLIMSALILCGGVGLIFLNLIAGITVSVVGFLACLICVIGRFMPRKMGGNDDYQSLLASKQSELNGYAEIRQEYEKNLNGILSKYNLQGVEFGVAFKTIKNTASELERLIVEYEEIVAQIKELEKDADVLGQTTCTDNVENLKKQISNLQQSYNEHVNRVATKKANADKYENLASTLPDLESRMLELNEKISTAEKEYKILQNTMKFLKEADENLKIKYRLPLEDGLNKYLSKIADGGIGRARIDVDLNVTIEENGESKDAEYYSKGFKNLFEISKRFALIDVLFTKEKPFIILDDPFTNLDDSKLKEMLEFIKVLSSDYQILYFVCHESRRV